MDCIELTLTSASIQDPQGYVGGAPLLPCASDWPRCRICGDELVHSFDVELPAGFEPFLAGSRLQIFACRTQDDIAGTPYSDYSRFASATGSFRLPESFWQINDGHYLVRLLPPGTALDKAHVESRLLLQNLQQTRKADSEADPAPIFKLFGHPSWWQAPEDHECACGAPMRLLMQIPSGSGFPIGAGAPAQANSFSKREYRLFLGNELYLLACTEQCHPQALWPVLQND